MEGMAPGGPAKKRDLDGFHRLLSQSLLLIRKMFETGEDINNANMVSRTVSAKIHLIGIGIFEALIEEHVAFSKMFLSVLISCTTHLVNQIDCF